MKAYILFYNIAEIIEDVCGPQASLMDKELTDEQLLLIEERVRTMRVLNMRQEVPSGNGNQAS